MYELKKTMDDIIDLTYPNNPNLSKYKKYYIEFVKKELSSKHGDYVLLTHKIHVYNLSRQNDSILTTSIHELAHHVDSINRHATDHSIAFYTVYNELLTTALNMKLITRDIVYETIENSSSRRKVRKMLDAWVPQYISYKTNKKMVLVSNCYNEKDILSAHDYHFNGLNKKWVKEIDIEQEPAEKMFLKTLNVNYSINDSKNIDIGAITNIIISGNTYPVREVLNENKFYYKDKTWKKPVAMNTMHKEIERLMKLEALKGLTIRPE